MASRRTKTTRASDAFAHAAGDILKTNSTNGWAGRLRAVTAKGGLSCDLLWDGVQVARVRLDSAADPEVKQRLIQLLSCGIEYAAHLIRELEEAPKTNATRAAVRREVFGISE